MSFTITQDQLEEITNTVNIDADDVRTDYSGRGMYGNSCIGIVGSAKDAMIFMIALTEVLGAETAASIAGSTLTDGMGRSIITYWPNLHLEG